MGLDSAAILARWLLEPSSRDFDLADLVVLTAQVGSEYAATERLMNTHLVPLMRTLGVRYVQVARQPRPAGVRTEPGYVVLDDSRPTRMHMRGPVTLYDELRVSGTLPQVAHHARRCSQKFKADPMDRWIARNIAGPHIQVIGFAAEETERAERDKSYSRNARIARHVLIEWGWDRQACDDYLLAAFGERWARSACSFCPFQFGRHVGQLVQRWRAEPGAAVEALLLEQMALALNPNSTLTGRKQSALDLARQAGLTEVTSELERRLSSHWWALYRVRRIIHAKNGDPAVKGHSRRSVAVVAEGTAAQMTELVSRWRGADIQLDAHGFTRVWIARRGSVYPVTEHFLVAAPAIAQAKQDKNFEASWAAIAGPCS